MSGKRGKEDSVNSDVAEKEVGRLVDCSQADDRRVIELVRARRLLYARNNMPVASYYSQVKKLWQEVATEMGWTVAEVRRKWSHIRNSYSRHLRNEMFGARTGRGRHVSKWYLADELHFLREHMATDTRPPARFAYMPLYVDMNDKTEEGVSEPASPAQLTPAALNMKPLISARPWFDLSSPTLTPPETAAAAARLSHSCSPLSLELEENSAYFQFFRGIYNDYQELSAARQRQFRRECLTLLHRLLDADAEGGGGGGQEHAINLSHHHEPLHSPEPAALSDDERDSKMCIIRHIGSDDTAPATPPPSDTLHH